MRERGFAVTGSHTRNYVEKLLSPLGKQHEEDTMEEWIETEAET